MAPLEPELTAPALPVNALLAGQVVPPALRVQPGNRVRTYSLALSGGSLTVPGPLRKKKSASGFVSSLRWLEINT